MCVMCVGGAQRYGDGDGGGVMLRGTGVMLGAVTRGGRRGVGGLEVIAGVIAGPP